MTLEDLFQLRDAYRAGEVRLFVSYAVSSPEVDAWLKDCNAAVLAHVEAEIARRMN